MGSRSTTWQRARPPTSHRARRPPTNSTAWSRPARTSPASTSPRRNSSTKEKGPGAANLYLAEGGDVEYLATLAGDPAYRTTGFPYSSQSDATADGRLLAINSRAQLTSYDNEGVPMVYLYDDDTGEFDCASCNDLAPSLYGARLYGFDELGYASALLFRDPDNLSADGSRLVFVTRESLVSQDGNGNLNDVYVREGGETRLLSGGAPGSGASYQGVSPSGDDVFITTQAQLVAQDKDQISDVYDIRVGGGFASQSTFPSPSQPCAGDACRPALPPPPAEPAPASRDVRGSGNAAPQQHKKQQHKKQQQRKKKKQQKKKQTKQAKRNQRNHAPNNHRNG